MDWRKLYLRLIFSVYTFFQNIALRGRKIADHRVLAKTAAACKLSEKQIRRNLKEHTDGPGNAAVASVVDALSKPMKRAA